MIFNPECKACEVLKQQIDYLQRQNQYLLDRLLHKDEPTPVNTPEDAPIKINTSRFVPWTVRRQMLEQEDRAKAKILKEREAEIQELEKEVLETKIEGL